MPAGNGFVHYPQQPSPQAAQVGSDAEAQVMQARLAALARSRPGFLPYQGAGVGAALQGPPAMGGPAAPATPFPLMAGAPALTGPSAAPGGVDAPPSVGAALLQRKAQHAAHLGTLGVPPADARRFTTGGTNGR